MTGISDDDYATVAYDAATGRELWTATYNGAADSWDWAVDVGVDASGSIVVVTGDSLSESGGWDIVTLAYTPPREHSSGRIDSTDAIAMEPRPWPCTPPIPWRTSRAEAMWASRPPST